MNDRVANPFGELVVAQPQGGAMMQAEQQRAVAEVIAAMQIARANPRNQVVAMNNILQDCMMPTLAEDATYDYSRGGSSIGGPSIRLAEAIARRWGNIRCGVTELARREGYSEVKAFAIDLETGTQDEKVFQVRHWRDTRSGGHALKEERDIYEIVANVAARRKRACILAIIPGDVVEAAVKQCELTLQTKLEINEDYIKKVLESFAQVGVTKDMIEKRIQRKIDALTPALAVSLRKIRTSIKDEMSGPADWFDMGTSTDAAGAKDDAAKGKLAGDLKAQAEAKKKADADAKAKAKADAEQKAKEDAEAKAKKGAPEPPKQEVVDQGTGEIHSIESIDKRIAAADKSAMDAILQDILKLPATPERAGVMQRWNERTMALTKDGSVKAPGTEEQLAKFIEGIRGSTSIEQLEERADLCSAYSWTAGQREKLNGAYYDMDAKLKEGK